MSAGLCGARRRNGKANRVFDGDASGNWLDEGWHAYPSRKAAADWLPFVRGAWRGLRAKVSQRTVRFEGGKVCEQSRRLLDEKYNLDA